MGYCVNLSLFQRERWCSFLQWSTEEILKTFCYRSSGPSLCSCWLSGREKTRFRTVVFLLCIHSFMLDSTTWIITELHLLKNTVQVKSASTGSCSAEINRLFAINFYRTQHRDFAVMRKGKKFGWADRYDTVCVKWSQSFSASSKIVLN